MVDHRSKIPEKSEPLWFEGVELPQFEPLNENINCDVVIVGGGITGIIASYLLSKHDLDIVLLESTRLLNGTTGHTTAKVTAQHNLIYDELLNNFGYNTARMYYEANADALQLIENIINEEQIDCDFQKQDAFLYSTSGEYKIKIENEYQAYDRLNIKGQITDKIPFDILIENALMMKNQAQFHPLKYLNKIVELIVQRGVKIFEETTAINVDSNEINHTQTVITRNDKKVQSNHVLICSHFPFYEGKGMYFSRLYAERSYSIALKTKMKYPGGMYLSVDQPTRSLRSALLNNEELTVIGGEEHKTGQGGDMIEHYKALKRFSDSLYGENSYEIVNRWSTQDLVTLDKIPYIGPITKAKQNVLIATGYRKWGMTTSHVAARIMVDHILENVNHVAEIFSPQRFQADPSLKKFFLENLDVAKHLIKGKLEPAHAKIEELKNDEGAVVKLNGERKGAYRDETGEVHIVDTTCTHAGCEVNWNSGERSWDCPCHGSRFSYTGEVLEGPAEKPLAKHDFSSFDIFDDDKTGY